LLGWSEGESEKGLYKLLVMDKDGDRTKLVVPEDDDAIIDLQPFPPLTFGIVWLNDTIMNTKYTCTLTIKQDHLEARRALQKIMMEKQAAAKKIHISDCIDAFSKEEILGLDEAW
jgi:hypothetical protein